MHSTATHAQYSNFRKSKTKNVEKESFVLNSKLVYVSQFEAFLRTLGKKSFVCWSQILLS